MSSPRYYRAPLLRRLLPWTYLGFFCVMAPLLVLYSSGYRYNFKKGFVERNGTLIVDSTPKGAKVVINGQDTKEKTPITFQNMVPGWQRLEVSKAGYHSWEETLLIRPERVSFAHQIWLWKDTQPLFIAEEPIVNLEADPPGEKAAVILQNGTSTSPTLHFWLPDTGLTPPIAIPNITAEHASKIVLHWEEDGQALLLTDSTEGKSWWTKYQVEGGTAMALPTGTYHWSKNELIGNDGQNHLQFDAIHAQIIRTPLSSPLLEQSTGLDLRTSSSTQQRILSDHSLLTRLFLLPAGQWEFAEIKRPFILLKDGVDRWLGLQLTFGQPLVQTLTGDFPRWNSKSDVDTAAFLHGGELWIWEMGKEPQLIWRQGDALSQAAWHRSGRSLFFVDQTQLRVIGLDDPIQTMQVLATFDHIQGLTVIGKDVYIAGQKNGQSGLWKQVVE